jgi:stage II sporulation protein D
MPFERAVFLKAGAAALFTGGLDIWSETTAAPQIRILISADRGRELPQRGDGAMFTFAGRRWRGTPSIVALPDGRSGVVMSQNDQRFGGIDAEYPSTNAAVDTTRTSVLTYAGGPASVFYAACCGGHTADAANLWGHTQLPYLRGVPDPYCMAAPDYRWQRTISRDRLQSDLAARVGAPITAFEIGPAQADGRPESIDVVAGERRATVSTIDFRKLVGADTIRSTWIERITLDAREVIVAGAGRGHGVGLCQWGARAMASAGATSEAILAFYFPGTRIAAFDPGT